MQQHVEYIFVLQSRLQMHEHGGCNAIFRIVLIGCACYESNFAYHWNEEQLQLQNDQLTDDNPF